MPKQLQNLTGNRYSKLKVLKRAVENSSRGSARWDCVCDCGEYTTVIGENLKSGSQKSCGCWRREGMSIRQKTHGLSRTSIYYIWAGIKKRCFKINDSHYLNYGGRGITMCGRWKNSFESFLEDMGERPSNKHSIERKDNNGNYEPGNCVWALPKEQARNRRNVVKYLFRDKLMTLSEVSELTGIHEDTLRYRLRSGFVLEEAVQKGRIFIRDRKSNGLD